MNIAALFEAYELESHARLTDLIENHCSHVPKKVFLDFMAKIYKRKK
jgi:hypothetical protein